MWKEKLKVEWEKTLWGVISDKDSENEYIVKAKDMEVEVKQSLKTLPMYYKVALFLCVFFWTFTIWGLFNFDNYLATKVIVLMILIGYILIFIDNLWKIKIQDRIIYIDHFFRHTKIEYKNLLKFSQIYHRRSYRTEGYYTIYIRYAEKNEIKSLNLPQVKVGNSQLKTMYEICNTFITNKQLKTIENLDSDYFDIKNEWQNVKGEKLDIKEIHEFYNVTYIFLIIIVIILAIGLYIEFKNLANL